MEAPPLVDGAVVDGGGPSGRMRLGLVLVMAAMVLPLVLSVVGWTGWPGSRSALAGTVGLTAVLALGAAIVAPVGALRRVVVMAVTLVAGTLGVWMLAGDGVDGWAALGAAVIGPFEVPALAWMGAALGSTAGDPARRSWATAVRLTTAVAVLQAVTVVAVILTYGAVFAPIGGVATYVATGTALAAAGTVASLHVVVCGARTLRALDGRPPTRLRPWALVVALTAAVALAVVSVLASMSV